MKAYQLLVTLEEVEPSVWRRFVIPAETNFKRLHDTLQFLMGWYDYHLYGFDFGEDKKGKRLENVGSEDMYKEHIFRQQHYRDNPPEEGENEFEARIRENVIRTNMRKAKTTKLPKYVEQYKEFRYVYDYGDHWEHVIKLEKIMDDYPKGHPILIEGEGACPPEDVGGPGGYEEFLKAWNDPSHPDHEDMKNWGESQYYQELDIDDINTHMKNILKLKKVK